MSNELLREICQIFRYICLGGHFYLFVSLYGGQKLTSGVFLNCFLFYFLREPLSSLDQIILGILLFSLQNAKDGECAPALSFFSPIPNYIYLFVGGGDTCAIMIL